MSELFVERVEPVRDDGVHLQAVRVTPDEDVAIGCHGAGVVVAAGAGDDREAVMETLVKPLGDAGYFVVAVALGDELAEAIEDLHAAVLSVKELARGKIGVVGVGGAATAALAAAAQLPHLDAVVHAGGALPPPSTKLSRVRAAVLVHAAGGVPAEAERAALPDRLRPSRASLTIRHHDAPAGFFTSDTAEGRIAREQTRQFLDLTLT